MVWRCRKQKPLSALAYESSKAQSLESKGDRSFGEIESERKKVAIFFQNSDILIDMPVICKYVKNRLTLMYV